MEEDLLWFLQTAGSSWEKIAIMPWSTEKEGQTFIAFSSSKLEALGRPFDTSAQGGAAQMLNSMRKTHIPVLLEIVEVEQEFLFFHPRKSR